MKTRAIVTGAAGPVGRRVQEKLINAITGDSDIEFVACVERTDVPELFLDTPDKIWVKADLDVINADWWLDLIADNDINTIYYLETTENSNEFLSSSILNNQYRESDTTFIVSLQNLYIDPDYTKIKVVYLSTDKIYQQDEFPNELNDIILAQPEGNVEESNPISNYAALKINTELELTSMPNLNLRILRPFSMAAPENDAFWPLTYLVLEAISDKDISVLEDGLRGLAFMHVDDLVDFITHTNLFNPEIELLSRNINVARVRNYLSEELLIKKVIMKTDSASGMDLGTTEDNFKYLMRIPQIRNSSLIFEPRIPIEKVIEDLHFALDPVNEYNELFVTEVEYIEDNYLVIKGLAHPGSAISIFIGSGQTLVTETGETGSWVAMSEDPINYNEPMEGTAYATSDIGVQYDTYLFDIPAANPAN